MKPGLLKEYAEAGLIVGPNEDEKEFLGRIQKMTSQEFCIEAKKTFPLSAYPSTFDRLKTVFGITPHWIKGFYGSKGLPFWQGAAMWIYSNKKDLIPFPMIQIGRLRKGYLLDELLSHESVHAMRVAFEEPKFEEILAYLTSTKGYRKVLGPLFQKPNEVILYLGFLGAALIGSWFSLYCYAVPFLYIGFLGCRLFWQRHLFKKCINNLKRLFLSYLNPFKLALHLTDKEIVLFAKSNPEKLKNYIEEQKKTSLRWLQIIEVVTRR